MKSHKKRTLFLYYDPHLSHAAMAKAIRADFYPAPKLMSNKNGLLYNIYGTASIIKLAILIPKNYDTYLCEGTYIFPAMTKRLALIRKDAKIINILASPLLYYIKTGVIKSVKKALVLTLLKEVDGFVCIGKMEKDLIKEFIPNAKTMITYPFIDKKTYKEMLNKANRIPNLESHSILIIGKNDAYYKGVDILVEAFKLVKKKWPDAELNIVGNMKNMEIYTKGVEGVNPLGYVKDLVSIIKKSALYVHPGRGDAFPVSTLEAMLSGLPAIVSNATGTKEVVKKLGCEFIVPLNPKSLYIAINDYFMQSYQNKLILSKKASRLASQFKEKEIIAKFRKDYFNLIRNT